MDEGRYTVSQAREDLAGIDPDAQLMIELDGEYYPISEIGGFRKALDDHGDTYVVLADSI